MVGGAGRLHGDAEPLPAQDLLRLQDEPGGSVAHVRRKREAAAEELAEYREIEKRIKDDERSYFGYATLRWGMAQERAWIRWADGFLEELDSR